MDADCVVHRDSWIERHLETEADFRPSQDYNGINCGVFLIRNCPWSFQFLETLLFAGDVADDKAFGRNDGCKWEQNSIKSLSQSFRKISDRIGALPGELVSNTTTGFRRESAIHHAYAMGNAERVTLLSGIFQAARAEAEAARRPVSASVVCLMVTRNRLALVQRSVRCFQEQTHGSRELLVLDDGTDETGAFIAGLGDPSIRHARPDSPGLKLGQLRNLAVKMARGRYVMQWDDDDWHHPDRIKMQLAALHYARSEFLFLFPDAHSPGRRRESSATQGSMDARDRFLD